MKAFLTPSSRSNGVYRYGSDDVSFASLWFRCWGAKRIFSHFILVVSISTFVMAVFTFVMSLQSKIETIGGGAIGDGAGRIWNLGYLFRNVVYDGHYACGRGCDVGFLYGGRYIDGEVGEQYIGCSAIVFFLGVAWRVIGLFEVWGL